MIIQCTKCSAKFRFDDALMRDEGVWVRCGLCRYEFFQSHPLASPAPPKAKISVPDIAEIQIDHETEMLSDIRTEEIPAETDIGDGEREPVASKTGRSPSALRILVVLLVALPVIAGLSFLAFPDMGNQLIGDLSSYLPWIEQKHPSKPSLEEGIRFEAINQRFVANVSVGNLRVVEGIAVNQSGHPLARLRVKAVLVDPQGKLLGEKLAYAGHMLPDAELVVLTEQEINGRLTSPGGSMASNERIMHGSRIPFMIVWAFEPPGAAKTFVTVAGVERLLQ